MENKEKKIKKLHQRIRKCKKCSLWRTRTNAVPGEGRGGAKIMAIGQAPGATEDKTGRPFVGRAGQLLNRLFKLAKIKRERVFITSPIKCFPPKNRQPARKEIIACLPYLLEQIDIINPKKIILLGGVAFSIFFPKQKLGKPSTRAKLGAGLVPHRNKVSGAGFRGRWIKAQNRYFFPTYHPAAGLRFPRIKKILEKDFKKLTRLKN